jgi:hypothetical protein
MPKRESEKWLYGLENPHENRFGVNLAPKRVIKPGYSNLDMQKGQRGRAESKIIAMADQKIPHFSE